MGWGGEDELCAMYCANSFIFVSTRCAVLQVAPEKHRPGLVVHTVGHPLPWNLYGGSFVYHMPDRNQVSLG